MSKISDLLFPPHCLICDYPGSHFCKSCASSLVHTSKQSEISGVKHSAGALYGDVLSQLILMAKEQNISAARNVLVDLLVHAYMKLGAGSDVNPPITLIPIPSSRSANRTRGYRHSYLLARGLRDRLHEKSHPGVEVLELLKVNRKISDMSALTKAERLENVQGAYSMTRTPREEMAEGKSVILLDDVATTGSSINEAIRCLREAKIQPFGAISAGVSPLLIS